MIRSTMTVLNRQSCRRGLHSVFVNTNWELGTAMGGEKVGAEKTGEKDKRNIEGIKRTTQVWRKSNGDIQLAALPIPLTLSFLVYKKPIKRQCKWSVREELKRREER